MKLIFSAFAFMLTMSLISSSCEKNVINEIPKVEGGTNITIKLPLDSAELRASASDIDDTAFTIAWSKLTGDAGVEILNSQLLSTWVRNLKEGSTTFQIKVTDYHGNSAFDTVTITVLPAEIHTIELNPSHNPTEVHLFGSSTIDQSTTNAPELAGGSGTYLGDPANIRAILQFDLSDIPQNAVIHSAKLTLFSNHTPLNGQNGLANSGTDNSLYLQRVTDAWDPTSINWLNQPGGSASNQVSIPHTNEAFLDVEADVTALVTDMMSTHNYGFLLKLKNEVPYNFRVFCSSKYSDATRYPKLEVNYTQ